MRFGKGSLGRGYKTRLVPAINSSRDLLDWWMVDVRHQFGDDYTNPEALLLPSERLPAPDTGLCRRAGDQVLRDGLTRAVGLWPAWINQQLGMSRPVIRRDRILDEAHATSGGIRALTDLFGLTAAGAMPYVISFNRAAS